MESDKNIETKKRARGPNISSINTRKLFYDMFGDVTISFHGSQGSYKEPNYLISKEDAKLWITALAKRTSQTLPTLSMRNESTLYPFVFDTICYTLLLAQVDEDTCPTSVVIEGEHKFEINEDTNENISEEVDVDKLLMNASIPRDIKLQVVLEEYLKNDKLTGYLEFVIRNMKLNKIHSLVEVKTYFSIDVETSSGFWQLCAELMTSQSMNSDPDTPIFGALTDGFSWCFVKLQQKFISVSDVISGFEKVYRFTQCTEKVFPLFNYLLAMVNWSGNISVKDAMSIVERKIEENTKSYFNNLDNLERVREVGMLKGEQVGMLKGIVKGKIEVMKKMRLSVDEAFKNIDDQTISRESFDELWDRAK